MTRFIDDLENRPGTRSPTPAEVDAIIAEARVLRSRAFASAFSGVLSALSRAVRTAPRHARVLPSSAFGTAPTRGAARG
ncbi:MAG: hypothetical protein AAF371_03700 [Pseudomonadota bacterium]